MQTRECEPMGGKGKDQKKKIDPSKTIWVGNIPAETKFQEGDGLNGLGMERMRSGS